MTGGRLPIGTVDPTDELWLHDPVAGLSETSAPLGPIYAHAAADTDNGIVSLFGVALYQYELTT